MTMLSPETWIGRTERRDDVIDANRARALQATLDRAPDLADGDPLPPAWHWLYFWDLAPASALGPEGHPARGEFLPPIRLPRRMWAGGRIEFPQPLPIGAPARKVSTIADVTEKRGRTGALAFVTVRHAVYGPNGLCVMEEQDIVYRNAQPPGEPPPEPEPAPADARWQRRIAPDPVLLFRYSALTFNAHRIHYDAPYTQADEGYPGLVVHGPLMATLLLDLLIREAGRPVPARVAYRAVSPVTLPEPFLVAGRPGEPGQPVSEELWAAGQDGRLCMHATTRPEPTF